jgi:hypothetical protein
MIKPLIFQLPSSKIELMNDNKVLYSTSSINSQPLFNYGFHHYINQSKDKLVILNNDDLKGKSFYNIVENFDDNIPNDESNIKNNNKKLFGIETTRDKLELWEILTLFGLNGTLYINDENFDAIIKSFFSKSGLKYKMSNELKKIDTYININEQNVDIKQIEQNHYINIIESIIDITEALNNDGNCVIKIYDTYTEVSLKLIKLLSEMFDESYIYKPYMSYGRESTKFFIGLGYKNNFKYSSKLKDILKELNNNNKLNNIYNNHSLNDDFVFVMKYMNIILGNYEHRMINVLVDYIKKSNYFGDVFHTNVEKQKANSKFWIEHFCSNNYKKASEILNSLIDKVIKENNDQINNMFKLMI